MLAVVGSVSAPTTVEGVENTMSRLLGVMALAGMLCLGVGITGCGKKTTKRTVVGTEGTHTTTRSSEGATTEHISRESTPAEGASTPRKRHTTPKGPELSTEPSGGTTVKKTPSGGTTIKKGTGASTTTKTSALQPNRDALSSDLASASLRPALFLSSCEALRRDGLSS
jgi:hypothetical protein